MELLLMSRSPFSPFFLVALCFPCLCFRVLATAVSRCVAALHNGLGGNASGYRQQQSLPHPCYNLVQLPPAQGAANTSGESTLTSFPDSIACKCFHGGHIAHCPPPPLLPPLSQFFCFVGCG